MFKKYITGILILIGSVIIGVSVGSAVEKLKQKSNTETLVTMEVDTIKGREIYLNDVPFDTIAFKNYLTEVNIKFPEVVYAQAVIESGNFKSDLFVKHNNPFGMKIAKQRPTLNTGGHPIYSSYYSWQHSVLDYAYFQSRFMKPYDTEEKYLIRLGEIYAEDTTYVSKVKQIIKR